MTDVLVTAVSNTKTRLLAMELRACPDAQKSVAQWLYIGQFFPYWTNRISSLVSGTGDNRRYELDLVARLNIAHISQAVEPAVQRDDGWEYVPLVLRYFEQYGHLKDQSTDAAIQYLAPDGITIRCPNGVDTLLNPLGGFMIAIDFEIMVPFNIGGTEMQF
jgi:hypothetical protein